MIKSLDMDIYVLCFMFIVYWLLVGITSVLRSYYIRILNMYCDY